MPKTSVQITWEVIDPEARADSTATVTTAQPFSKLDRLRTEDTSQGNYATLEFNQWSLDGSKTILPDDDAEVNAVWWSTTLSDDSGNFTPDPVMTVTFTEPHRSLGITFVFDELNFDFVNRLRIDWYAGLTQLDSQEFQPDAPVYFAQNSVTDYDRLVITFYSTNKPHRLLKLVDLIYGARRSLRDELIAASLLEQISPIANELAINTSRFSLLASDIDVLNPDGITDMLMRGQPVHISGTVDGVTRPLATHYLSEWESANNAVSEMSAVDLLGMLEQVSFPGDIYTGVSAGTLIDEIFTIFDPLNVKYELSPTLAGELLSGWLPKCTLREALRQIVFALGAIAVTSRSGVVRILRETEYRALRSIGSDRRSMSQTVRAAPHLTDITVNAHKYALGTEVKEIYRDIPAATGEMTVELTAPHGQFSVSNATIVRYNANSVTIDVPNATRTVTVRASVYEDAQVPVTRSDPARTAELRQTVEITDATLLDETRAAAAAERLFGYYSGRLSSEFDLVILGDERPGDTAQVWQSDVRELSGVIEAMDTDLVGGFVSSVKIGGGR